MLKNIFNMNSEKVQGKLYFSGQAQVAQ